jgi:hypothetical protein
MPRSIPARKVALKIKKAIIAMTMFKVRRRTGPFKAQLFMGLPASHR